MLIRAHGQLLEIGLHTSEKRRPVHDFKCSSDIAAGVDPGCGRGAIAPNKTSTEEILYFRPLNVLTFL